jgi:zinc D-Ala-D-Ala carboxypeptidase
VHSAQPAHAAPTPSPSTPATGTTSTGPAAVPEQTLSAAELEEQIRAAEKLRRDLLLSNAQIAAAATRLERLAGQANKLLQEYAKARDAERVAREEANKNVALFEQLNSQLSDDRKALGAWAYHAYMGGGSLVDLAALLDALSAPAEEAGDPVAQLAYITGERVHAYERVKGHASMQRDAAAKAVEATTRAMDAAKSAGEAKKKLDVAVAAQKAQLEATRSLHDAQVAKAGPIAGLLLGSEDERALETTNGLRKALNLPGLTFDDIARASCSGDDGEYPNGHIPAKALCPLYGDPIESLRPAAAAAFNRMSKAYERATGSPICITDSYRSLPEQIVVKAEKGMWAATPGTSEHGFGRALDLCGGINSFGTPAHLWMVQNAPLYGWFHPDWAAAGGSLPEPWHWEYAG